MILYTSVLSIIIMSIFCMGIDVLLSDGMILHALRRRYNECLKSIEDLKAVSAFNKRKDVDTVEYWAMAGQYGFDHKDDCIGKFSKTYLIGLEKTLSEKQTSNFVLIALIPIIGCPICFASVWGTVAFIILNGTSISLIPVWILCCVCTAFVNSLLIRI